MKLWKKPQSNSPDQQVSEAPYVDLSPYLSEHLQQRRSRIRRFFTRPSMKLLLNTHVEGKDNVEGIEGAYILIPNHQSHLDAPMIFSLLPDFLNERLATGAAADYFFRKKTIAKLTSLFFNTYPIERKGRPRPANQPNAAGMTGRLLKEGVPILVFPEGTRSRTGEIGDYKPGAAALAQKNNVPLIPIAMVGGHDAMPVGSIFPKLRSRVYLYIGKPMYSHEGETANAFMDRTFDAIKAMIRESSAYPAKADGTSYFN
ncbi:MAG: 1-acyl-sn-glycerol-3-phosphate acyltransferase [Actinomycetaceae bacterium]|nr:1-acyl-sn-glycerol-3-phosphate acyltransferase [Actinomycetaceae bacterium]